MKLLTPPPKISERAAEEIRTAILDGSLSPGSRIHQERLAARLGVSREPVRKALVLLEQEGLVKIVGRGAIVTPVDPQFLTDIYEFREVIEAYVAGKVATRTDFNPTKLRGILAKGHEYVETGAVGKLIELDEAFHKELYQACQNRVVIEVMKTQWSHIYRAMRMDLSMDSFRKEPWKEHTGVLDAIVRREVVLAKTLAASHIRSALARKEARSKRQQSSHRKERASRRR